MNYSELLLEAYKIGGIFAVNNLVELGHDLELASDIIDAIELYGTKIIMKTFFLRMCTEGQSSTRQSGPENKLNYLKSL